MKNLLYLVVTFTIMMTACIGASKEKLNGAVMEAEAKLKESVKGGRIDSSTAGMMLTAYNDYVKAFPGDSLAAQYLFKGAEILVSTGKYEEAINFYKKVYIQYHTNSKAPHSLFLWGFTAENNLKDLETARAKYTEFLQKYPKHELASSAQFSLDHLGKSPEEIVKEFEAKQKADSSMQKATRKGSIQ